MTPTCASGTASNASLNACLLGQRRQPGLKRRVDDPALRDDGADVACRSYVKGWIADLHSRRSRALPLEVRDLVRGTFLDRDVVARLGRQVKRAQRRGNIERNPVLARQDGDLI